MKIANNTVVGIHYTLCNAEGEQLDSSEGGEPLQYLHGAGNIVAGLENALADKGAGDSLTVVVQPEEGYGVYNEGLVQSVPRALFQGVDEIAVGARFEAQSDQGPISVVVTEVEEDSIVVDGNHPLAGKALHFDVTVTEVREASAEEIDHGHVH
ncbi:MAG: peptidylprolyl isomerase [Pseudomonadales bacterium]